MRDPFPIAIEFLQYERQVKRRSLRNIVESVQNELASKGYDIGSPDNLTPDDVTAWLVNVYVSYVDGQ